MQNDNYGLGELKCLTREKMSEHMLISRGEEITLLPHHPIKVQGEVCNHYIIFCSSSNKKYFLKVLKDNDSATHCNSFLRRFQDKNGDCPYPLIVAPGFGYCNRQYYFYTFAEGETLESLEGKLSVDEWKSIAIKLRDRVDELSEIHTSKYSDHNAFISDQYSDIIKRKILPKLKHSTFREYQRETILAAHRQCMKILDSSKFSKPTLLHMDVKPANVIYNPQTKIVSLIDFELSRFGDIDYGWAQILITKLKNYGEIYENYVFPYLIKDHLSWDDALHMPKFQCYLFYQAACNLIYYDERKIPCPKEMKTLFVRLLNQLAKE